jgi:hypothetical protein
MMSNFIDTNNRQKSGIISGLVKAPSAEEALKQTKATLPKGATGVVINDIHFVEEEPHREPVC